jgi:hypothetical protein
MSDLALYLPVPLSLVLPMLSLALLALALVTAGFAWAAGATRKPKRIDIWDCAAALAFIGCAAAIMGEIEHVVEYFMMDSKTRNP